ncbi:MAG: hypothetical protein AB7U05_00885 [Mangrovibacterium sp.]
MSVILLAAALYSLAVFFVPDHSPRQGSPLSETQTIETRSYFEVGPAGLLGEPLNPETCFNLLSATRHSKSEFQHNSFSAILKQTGKLLAVRFVNYTSQEINFPVRLHKADFLFPFHYFW